MPVGEPPHALGELSIFARPEHQVPVVRHHAERQQPHADLVARFAQHLFERCLVAKLLKDRSTIHCAIQHVVAIPSGCNAGKPWHAHGIPEPPHQCERMRPAPILSQNSSQNSGSLPVVSRTLFQDPRRLHRQFGPAAFHDFPHFARIEIARIASPLGGQRRGNAGRLAHHRAGRAHPC